MSLMGSEISISRWNFAGTSSENEPKQGSRKIGVLVVTDPPQKILTFFSSLYQCWLNCQKIFFGGNPWPVNNVRLFTQNCILAKMSPKLYIFAFFHAPRWGYTKKYILSFSIFSYQRPCPKDLKIVCILCAQSALLIAHESNFIAKMTDYGRNLGFTNTDYNFSCFTRGSPKNYIFSFTSFMYRRHCPKDLLIVCAVCELHT